MDGGAGDDVLQVLQSSSSEADNTAYYNTTNVFLGGTGNDLLIGSAGSDTYVFNRGDGQDTIRDNPLGSIYNTNDLRGGLIQDTVQFGSGITTADIGAQRSGDDLLVTIADSANPTANDQITIGNWFLGAQYRIENFSFTDGQQRHRCPGW